jgi:hypothetical protein
MATKCRYAVYYKPELLRDLSINLWLKKAYVDALSFS